jgi:hypothetical protein
MVNGHLAFALAAAALTVEAVSEVPAPTPEPMPRVGLRPERIRLHLDRLGWKQYQLAEVCEVDQSTIGKALRGHDIRASTLARIAWGLAVSTDYLCGLTDDPTPSRKLK